jgi:hypothetical protein
MEIGLRSSPGRKFTFQDPKKRTTREYFQLMRIYSVIWLNLKIQDLGQKYDVVWKGNKSLIFDSWEKCKRTSTALRGKV